MQVDVPIRDENGKIKVVMTLNDAQHQTVLQFGLNFLLATGLAASYGVDVSGLDNTPTKLDD
jgi:hypothetical protein